MYKPLADSTLHSMTKKEIIELLRTAEHNAKVSQEWVSQQTENLKDWKPVAYGRWISWEKAENFIPSPDRHECSVCHDAAQVLVNGLELLPDYCPNCGAKMDGGGDA